MTMTIREKILLAAGQQAQKGVSRGTTLIFKCPICKMDKARAVVSKTSNTLSVKCDICNLHVFDHDYHDSHHALTPRKE